MTDPPPPLQHTVIVRVGGAVNERCVGCAGGSTPERSLADLTRDFEAAQEQGARRVLLVGGEPTMRGDLAAVLKAAARLGLSAGLATNGRMLLYPGVRRRLLEAGVDYLRFSLHGGSAHEHDSLVGLDGAFAQALAALRAWLEEAPTEARVDVACTVTASNVDRLEPLAALLAGLAGRPRLVLRLVAPMSGVRPAPLETVSRHLGVLLSGQTALPTVWEGFPHGVLEAYAHLRCEDLRRELPALGPAEAGGAIPREEPQETTLRANSFNFELLAELDGFEANPADCPALDLELDGGPDRHLLLQRPGRADLYRSPTRDFADPVIRQVKEQTEQLYLDTSPRAALGELARHVRRVRALARCLDCQHRQACCGAAAVQPGDPFEPQERWLKEQLQKLRGRVLDVGCGEQPYQEQLGALVQSGEVEYHGLDPDRRALDTLAGSGLDENLHHGRVEEFAGHDGAFDWVLALRALNHVEDLERALDVMTAALAPGGRLLLSDMTVYGLLRTAEQVAAADAAGGPGGQQHFRNWDSHRVLQRCRRHPLDLLVHQPVTPGTSNEWFLLLERRP